MEWSQIFSFSFFSAKSPCLKMMLSLTSTSSLYTLLRLTSSFGGKVLHPHYFLDYIKSQIFYLIIRPVTHLCYIVLYSVLSRCLTVDIYTCCWQSFSASSLHVPTQPSEKCCLSFSKNVPGSIFCL